MQEYLQKLVIILPATAVAMGGLLLVVWMYSRRPDKGSESLLNPVPLRSVTTQVDESLQINPEIRNKLIEEAMESVKSILSENFRKKESTKISLEEFNNLYRKLDSGEDMDAKHMESAIRIPGVASLACEAAPQAVQKSDSFATLWVEELQKTGNGGDRNYISNKTSESRDSGIAEELPTPPQQLIPTETDEITQELGVIEATDDHMKSPHELKLIKDLELYLLTSSTNLYRSMKALQATLNEHHADVPTSMLSDYEYLERSAELVLASVASTSTACRTVPHVLKGGAGAAVRDFEWRLDIEEIQDVQESPPDTPLRRRLPSHLSRLVHEDHPPALSITDLDPELSYGWHRPEWKEKYGQYHVHNEHKGPGINRSQKLQLASDAHHNSKRVEARRKWDAIKDRYRGERGRALLRPEWRKHVRTLYSDSSSESRSDRPIRIRRPAGKLQGETPGIGTDDDPNRNKSALLTSSSSSSGPERDESHLQRVRKLLRNYSPRECKMEHRESPEADQGSSRLSSPSSEIE